MVPHKRGSNASWARGPWELSRLCRERPSGAHSPQPPLPRNTLAWQW